MTATEIVTVYGTREEVHVGRLSAAEELEARQDAIWNRYGAELSDDQFEEYLGACRVYYRDDLDVGTSEYTVQPEAGGTKPGPKRAGRMRQPLNVA